jgi:GT2 family glycosyltransferase
MTNDINILVGVPVPNNYFADSRVVAQMEAWATCRNVETYYPATGGPEVGQDRIVMFAKHMKPEITHILFVDYDVIPRPNTLKRLLSHDKDIVSGVYPICRQNHITWCLSREEPFKAMPINDLPRDMFKAKTVCNGMMLVKMGVFDKIKWPYFENHFQEGALLMGHDIDFCQKARKAGYDLWVDPKVKCKHTKTVELLGIVNNYIKE